jgi:hypothetical protein
LSASDAQSTRDDGCLICGRPSAVVPLGVYSEYAGEGERHGERVWICEECAQVESYARAFVFQAREQYGLHGGDDWQGLRLPETSFGFSYRIVSPVLRALIDEQGFNLFHAWTLDI